MFELYDYSLKNVELSGPTYFAPILREYTKQVREAYAKDQNAYSILLILTDGAINDMGPTKDLIVDASVLPLSIIIIGLGNADFSMMEELDGDDVVTNR